MKNKPAVLPAAVSLCAFLFYICWHSTFFNFDGVACAIAVELGDLRHLTHGNHLAYGVLALAWVRLWRLVGFAGPALLPLQTLDSLLGALGAGLFCRFLMRRLDCAPRIAAAAAAGLALSFAWWLWSLEAQVYMLGAVCLVLAADAAWAREPKPWRTGFFHALAVLGHVGHVMFVFCAAYLLYRPGRARCLWLRYGAALALTLLAAYAAAALWCVQPRNLEDMRVWLLGSAALPVDRSFTWYTGPTFWRNVVSWLLMTPRVFADPSGLAWPWAAPGWLLCALPLAAAAAGLAGWTREAKACLLWLAGYALLFHSWQPFTMVYRITDLLPLWSLVALCAGTVSWRPWALAGWVLAAGLYNGIFLILPQTDPVRNVEYQEALMIARDTPAQAWVVVRARAQVYVPYFAGRKPLNLRYFEGRPEELARRLEALQSLGMPVYITEATLRESGWADFFHGYDLQAAGAGPGEQLYFIGRKGNPSGSSQKKLNTAPATRKGPKGSGSDMRSSPLKTRPTP